MQANAGNTFFFFFPPHVKKHVCFTFFKQNPDCFLWILVLILCFRSANHNHMMALLQQLLYSESLSLSWRDIIVPVVRQIVQTVRPDVRNCDDDMDIRQLVHIKKVGSHALISKHCSPSSAFMAKGHM